MAEKDGGITQRRQGAKFPKGVVGWVPEKGADADTDFAAKWSAVGQAAHTGRLLFDRLSAANFSSPMKRIARCTHYRPGVNCTMRKIAVHCIVDPAEVAWAKQFAGEDADVKKQFPGAPFSERGRAAIPAVTWESIVSTIEKAAKTAGCGGWIGLVSGHGGSDCSQKDVLVQRCPVSSQRVATVYLDPHKRISFNQVTVFYKESPGPPSKSQQENDQDVLTGKIAGDKTQAQARLNTRKFYERIGVALASNRLQRLAFLVCSVGASTAFMDQIATDWGVDIAAFKFRTACGFDAGNKARLWMNKDSKDGQGTNTVEARVYTPNLDDPNIGYVARPRGVNVWERAKKMSCPSSPHDNVWERAKAAGGTHR